MAKKINPNRGSSNNSNKSKSVNLGYSPKKVRSGAENTRGSGSGNRPTKKD